MTKLKSRFLKLLTLLFVFNSSLNFADVDSVFVQSTLDYNAILITEVDVVFIYNDEALQALPTTKSGWYGNKRQILESQNEGIDVVNLFIPQGFDSSMLSLPDRRSDAIRVVVFGQHDVSTRPPVDITDMSDVLVQINQFGIVVSQQN